ncbi:MAG: hypothetical protein AB7V45_10845 [Candidatus Krumholzibacteriia bacterium]
MAAVWKTPTSLRIPRPRSSDLLLAGGALSLLLALTLVAGLPVLNRLEAAARLAALRGNAATFQLAAESYAARNFGTYPTDPLDLVPYLPGRRAPRNPFSGDRVRFREAPGDLTYASPTGGKDYVIRAWGFGPAGGSRVLVTLTGRGN